MSLFSLQNEISSAMADNEYSLGVFFDLAKAFYAVDHIMRGRI